MVSRNGSSRSNHKFTTDEGNDNGPTPDAFVALTVKVYVAPCGNPVNVAVVRGPATVSGGPEDGITSYFVMDAPPFEGGGLQTTITPGPMARAITFCGASGTLGRSAALRIAAA